MRNEQVISICPYYRIHVIPRGGHPAYLTNPRLWNTMIVNFMNLDDVRCN